jgi:hypothetical protein
MKKIIGTRGSGKTTKLIEQAAKENLVIVTATDTQANNIRKRADELGLTIVATSLKNIGNDNTNTNNFDRGSVLAALMRKNGILIDDADLVLTRLLSDITIKGISLTCEQPDRFWDDLLITAGKTAAYMECSRVINLPYRTEEDELIGFITGAVSEYIREETDIPFNYYIETRLLKEYGVKED